MSRVSTYLNFQGDTEEAFTFYASVFGTEFSVPFQRFGEMPSGPGAPEIPEEERSKVLHVELPILAGHVLMGTDMLESMGHLLKVGNNTTLNLEPDTREEAERLYAALSEGGQLVNPADYVRRLNRLLVRRCSMIFTPRRRCISW